MPFSLLLSLHTGIVGGNWEIISDAANADGITESMIKKVYIGKLLSATMIISPFYVRETLSSDTKKLKGLNNLLL